MADYFQNKIGLLFFVSVRENELDEIHGFHFDEQDLWWHGLVNTSNGSMDVNLFSDSTIVFLYIDSQDGLKCPTSKS